ncbi:hypothetical protein HK101_010164 [Irineochytrium annulatum]|nr:hypothetical protein HK101_010164 [Irineochytrium annulatum]
MQFEGAGAEGAAGMPWVEPEFKVEVVCTSCLSLYRFCSSCGGGSKRSGKWRPKEMFSANRKTCCLSHIRLGDASQFRVVSYRPISDHTGRTMTLDAVQMEGEPMDAIPFANGDPEDRIVAFADLVAEHMHQTVLQINDATMLRGAAFDTWPKMIGRMSDLKSDVTNFIRGRLPHSRDPTRVREHRRYITVIYVPNPKPKGKRRDPSEVVENGRRDWIMVASMLNAWNVEGRHSYTINTGTKGVMQDVKAPAWIVLKHNITRMAVDLSTLPDLIPPLHLSAWAQKGGKWEERIEMVSRQLGLLPLDEYVATRGEECRRVLEEDNFVRGEDRYLKVIFAGPADSKSIIKF